jgi:D-arabinose 5-phosphate isomerase GutQ
VAHLTERLDKLAASTDSNLSKIATKHLKHLDNTIVAISDAITSPLGDNAICAICLLEQYKERLAEFKAKYSDVRRSLLSCDVEEYV